MMDSSTYRDIIDLFYAAAFIGLCIAGGALIFGHWWPPVAFAAALCGAVGYAMDWWRWG